MMKRGRSGLDNEPSMKTASKCSLSSESEAHQHDRVDAHQALHLSDDNYRSYDFEMPRGAGGSLVAPPEDSSLHGATGTSSHLFANQTLLSNDQREQSHFHDVCNAYRQYSIFAVQQWLNQQFRIQSLPQAQRSFLPDALRPDSLANQQRTLEYKESAIRNQFCLDCILRHAGQPHSQQHTSTSYNSSTEGQISKVSSVLKSLARDWSFEGRAERNMCYVPIINAVRKYVSRIQSPSVGGIRKPSRICVPGAGVGRLMCELSALGYTVQGNEFSLHMLLASDFILNGSVKADQPLQISPWLLETRNLHSSADQFRTVSIPDRDAFEIMSSSSHIISRDSELAEDPDFSMAAGDFATVYNSPSEFGMWDCVVACFFLDASPCIIEYLQVCYQMLRPNGYLISFGPLLWHWSGPAMMDQSLQEYQNRYRHLDPKYLQSVDFNLEDIKEILLNIGFEIMECSPGHTAMYTADRRSMMNTEYQCVNLVARKGV